MMSMKYHLETIKPPFENASKRENGFKMKNEFDLNKIFRIGRIKNEIELEQASIAERQLKLLSRDQPNLKSKRMELMRLIDEYEAQHWTDREMISDEQIIESDQSEK